MFLFLLHKICLLHFSYPVSICWPNSLFMTQTMIRVEVISCNLINWCRTQEKKKKNIEEVRFLLAAQRNTNTTILSPPPPFTLVWLSSWLKNSEISCVIQGQTIVLHHRLLGTAYFMIVLILRHLFSLTYTDIHIYLSYPLSWFWTG